MSTGREYPARPLVGIGAVVLRGDEVLLVRRGKPPSEGEWAIPGGAQRVGETAEEAARRELLEETGLEVGPMVLVGNVDSIHRDAEGQVQFHYTILDFAASWTGGTPRAGGDATDARFFAPGQLPPLNLWTEAHRIIGLARDVLGAKTVATAPPPG